MIIRYSSNFANRLAKLKKKNKLIEKKVDQRLKLLVINPNYPSLRLHKIESHENTWSISVEADLRILFVYRDYGILLVS